jgi:hypothetical protein
MSEQVTSEPFRALASALQDGHADHARRLQGILNGTWTTSTELIAELGAAVIAIRDECRPLSEAQRKLVKECLRQVRKAWPGFGYFGWFRSLRGRLNGSGNRG